LQERDVGWLVDPSAAIRKPGLATANETEDMLTEGPLLVEEVDPKRWVPFEKQVDSLADRSGFQLDPPGRTDSRFKQPR
jgi:hypothetical protein